MKVTFLIALVLFISPKIIGQGRSMLPSHLPEFFLGSWLDDRNKLVCIVTKNYLVINDELYYYNNLVVDKSILNITGIKEFNIKYVNFILNEDLNSITLDEGYKITNLHKNLSEEINEIPAELRANWLNNKDNLELKAKTGVFENSEYVLDYISLTFKAYHFVLYNDGDYFLLNSFRTNKGYFLNFDFRDNIILKKESTLQKYKALILALSFVFLASLGYLLFNWKIKRAQKKEENKRILTEMQLKTIRSQMNPHFLFNALSAIQNLINNGSSDQANHYLSEFSQLMRLTLEKTEKGLVTLSDEIKTIKKYLELEKLRFPFETLIKIDSNINTYEIEIPAMLIQPFVENAIIHGLKAKIGEKKLEIRFDICENKLRCYIDDNGLGVNATQIKTKILPKREQFGIKLAEDRISLINESYGTRANVIIKDKSQNNPLVTGTIVTISLPLEY